MAEDAKRKIARLEALLEQVRTRARGGDHISTLPPPPASSVAPAPRIYTPPPTPPGLQAIDVGWDSEATVIAAQPLAFDLPDGEDRPATLPPPTGDASAASWTAPTPPVDTQLRHGSVPPEYGATTRAGETRAEGDAPADASDARTNASVGGAKGAGANPPSARPAEGREARRFARKQKALARKERAREKEAARRAKAKVPLHVGARRVRAERDAPPAEHGDRSARLDRIATRARAPAGPSRANAPTGESVHTLTARRLRLPGATARDRAQWKILAIVVAVMALLGAVGAALLAQHR